MFCPECQSEYVDGIFKCPVCEVWLVNFQEREPEPSGQNFIYDDDELVAVWETPDRAELPLVRSLLEEAGIPCATTGDDQNGVMTRGIYNRAYLKSDDAQVLVPEQHETRAIAILEQSFKEGPPDRGDEPERQPRSPRAHFEESFLKSVQEAEAEDDRLTKEEILEIIRKISGMESATTDLVQYEVEHGGRFVFYKFCISLIIITWECNSELRFIRGGESAVLKGLPFSMISLLLGWWGIPWGPINTIGTLVTNFSGGVDVTDGLISSLADKPP
jgi:hypothetical protein